MAEQAKRKPGRPRTRPIKVPVYVKGVERPFTWITGPDKYKHDMYHPWQMAKAQAKFRGEEWELTFEEYYELWKDHWNNRGRKAEDMCMSRHDREGPWDIKNTLIMSRLDHLRKQGGDRRGKGKKTRKPVIGK